MKGSAKVNNLIIDFTDKGKVVGLEIQEATQFFKDMHLDGLPEKMKSAALSVKQAHGVIILFVSFRFEDRNEERAIYVSSQSPTYAEASC